jgi:hypothetical protein
MKCTASRAGFEASKAGEMEINTNSQVKHQRTVITKDELVKNKQQGGQTGKTKSRQELTRIKVNKLPS